MKNPRVILISILAILLLVPLFVFAADPGQLNPWSQATALPSALQTAGAVASGTAIYVIGGLDASSNATSTVFYTSSTAASDGTLNAWKTTNALTAVDRAGESVIANGYIYVVGGISTGSNVTSTIWYTSSTANGTNAWKTTTALPNSNLIHGGVVASGTTLYYIGGDTAGTATTTVLYTSSTVSGTLNPWKITTGLVASTTGHSAFLPTVIANGYIYMIGGQNPGLLTNATGTVWYTSSTDNGVNAWKKTTSLPVGMERFGVVASGTYIYVLGGIAINAPTSTVYYTSSTADGTLNPWLTTSTSNFSSSTYNVQAVTTGGFIYTLGGSNAVSVATSTVNFTSQIEPPAPTTLDTSRRIFHGVVRPKR